jgi:hypothetical protein
VRLLGLNDLPSDGLPPFNLKLAHELYESLVGQFKGLIEDKRLLIVPSGPLTSLPFHVLVTEKPQVAIPANADYRGVLWLGRSHANSVLPSVASLKALRESAGKWNGEMTDSYIGFGNPLLSGPRKADIRAWERQNCSKSFAPESLHLVGRARPQGIAKFFRGGLPMLMRSEVRTPYLKRPMNFVLLLAYSKRMTTLSISEKMRRRRLSRVCPMMAAFPSVVSFILRPTVSLPARPNRLEPPKQNQHCC